MAEGYITEGMLEMFLYESGQMLEQLEQIALEGETAGSFDEKSVNEIFRIMHTIKGSSGVMLYPEITKVSHKLEDVFYYIRESKPTEIPQAELVACILDVSDFIKGELDKIRNGKKATGSSKKLDSKLSKLLDHLKNHIVGRGDELPPENVYQAPKNFYISPADHTKSHYYFIRIFYKSDTEMANIRAYMAVYALKDTAEDIRFEPADIITNEETSSVIMSDGFSVSLQTHLSEDEVLRLVDQCADVANIEISECSPEEFLAQTARELSSTTAEQSSQTLEICLDDDSILQQPILTERNQVESKPEKISQIKQSFISVNVNKMDQLMDLIGELVIAEAVVIQNPDLKVPGLDLTSFQKSAAQLSKITSELQDVIMAMRMMPLGNTFQKMNRIVHDVSRNLKKEIDLEIIGESTEVDKNIIEHISDPIMHLVRNAVDHGIELPEEREKCGKPRRGKVTLEAKNEGGKVWITVRDNGKGLSREVILRKAKENGLLAGRSDKELSDREVFNFITLPGFSTKEQVTEYSGRGVGMDVVVQNIQQVGGSIDIDSKEGEGSVMTLKIPLTLAIIDGIILGVGKMTYVVATGDVKEFVRVQEEQLVREPEGDEAIMLRGECLPVLRLKEYFGLRDGQDEVSQGIMAILEHEGRKAAILLDTLLGEQEIVVKPMPSYIKKVHGISGCTQLGDGSISLILDTGSLMKE